MYMYTCMGGTAVLWFVHSSPNLAIQVQVLAGNIMFCSWARHFTLNIPHSAQVYKWYRRRGVTLQWTSIPSRGELEIPLVASCFRNWDKLSLKGHLSICRPYLTLHNKYACKYKTCHLPNSWDNVCRNQCECVVKFGKLASILLTVTYYNFFFYATTPLIYFC